MRWNDAPLRTNLPSVPEREAVLRLCQRWKIQSLDYFGSILTDRFNPESDVDLLVAFDSTAQWGLFDHAQMEADFEALLGRRVDLVSKRAIEQSRNPYRKGEILGSKQEFYAA